MGIIPMHGVVCFNLLGNPLRGFHGNLKLAHVWEITAENGMKSVMEALAHIIGTREIIEDPAGMDIPVLDLQLSIRVLASLCLEFAPPRVYRAYQWREGRHIRLCSHF